MRVELQTEGGIAFFPGLNKPVVLNSSDLPKEQAAQLQRLLDSTHFFDLPAASRSLPKGAADMRRYTITVEDGQRRRTVRLNDPVDDTHLRALIDFVQGQRGS
jgi:emfourin